jgi:hypothetical protein
MWRRLGTLLVLAGCTVFLEVGCQKARRARQRVPVRVRNGRKEGKGSRRISNKFGGSARPPRGTREGPVRGGDGLRLRRGHPVDLAKLAQWYQKARSRHALACARLGGPVRGTGVTEDRRCLVLREGVRRQGLRLLRVAARRVPPSTATKPPPPGRGCSAGSEPCPEAAFSTARRGRRARRARRGALRRPATGGRGRLPGTRRFAACSSGCRRQPADAWVMETQRSGRLRLANRKCGRRLARVRRGSPTVQRTKQRPLREYLLSSTPRKKHEAAFSGSSWWARKARVEGFTSTCRLRSY